MEYLFSRQRHKYKLFLDEISMREPLSSQLLDSQQLYCSITNWSNKHKHMKEFKHSEIIIVQDHDKNKPYVSIKYKLCNKGKKQRLVFHRKGHTGGPVGQCSFKLTAPYESVTAIVDIMGPHSTIGTATIRSVSIEVPEYHYGTIPGPVSESTHVPEETVARMERLALGGMTRNRSTNGRLADRWEARVDPASGRTYYVDHITRSTTWHRPDSSHTIALDQFSETVNQRTNPHYTARFTPGTANISRSSSSSISSSITSAGETNRPLPAGWQMRYTANGERYFVSHILKITQWADPRNTGTERALPAGWTKSVTVDGRVFFIDHNTHTTTFQDPRIARQTHATVPELITDESVPQYVRDFSHKLQDFYKKIKASSPPGEMQFEIDRKNIFQDSYSAIMSVTSMQDFKKKLKMRFKGEEGLDYGGLAKEWFFLLSVEMMNPNYCLFEYTNDRCTNMQVNPNSGVNPNHLDYFVFFGRIIGLAIYHGKFVDCGFTLNFYKVLLRRPLLLEDMEAVDPDFYKSLIWIRDNSVGDSSNESGLELYFTIDKRTFDNVEAIPMKPSGETERVTDANKKEYIDLIVVWKLYLLAKDQIESFVTGLSHVINLDSLQIFNESDLELLVCGVSEIDIHDWEANSKYKNYTSTSEQVVWFWDYVRQLDTEHKSRLLQFITGTCHIPIGGFKYLMGSNGPQPFVIEKFGTSDMLPRSHTCFNRLDLPPYTSYAELANKLTYAITETQGFGAE